MTGFIVSVFLFRNRVSSKEVFEGLELGEGKLSRPVLRGPGGRNAAWLLGLRPESCWNDCLTRRKSIRPCVPSHVAYEVGAARQQTVRSPRTMDPHSQEWHRNREATVYLPA